MDNVRIEADSLGEVSVPADRLWGAQTQRALRSFPSTGLKMPRAFIRALGLIKHAAAAANMELEDLPREVGLAIQAAALEVAAGRHDEQFPVDVNRATRWQLLRKVKLPAAMPTMVATM